MATKTGQIRIVELHLITRSQSSNDRLTRPSSSKAIEIFMPLGVESVYSVMFGLLASDIIATVFAARAARCSVDCLNLFNAVAIHSASKIVMS